MAQTEGKVYILGAGPGAADFLTVAGQTILSTAEVLIYDALIDPKLLTLAPKTCIHLWAGKRGQEPSTPQPEIDRLLITYCQQGKQVVRLKSGDPALFGRVASEIQALQSANCAYEVWPGLSSALAAPILAGIPLTDPVLSRSVTIASAHEIAAVDWDLMARSESLVILMGGRSLPLLIQSLQEHGKPAHTPIAIVRWGGWPQQEVWVGTLETIVEETRGERLSPAVMVIGEVVRLRETLAIPNFSALVPPSPLATMTEMTMTETHADLQSQQSRPLEGLTILVTRSASQAPAFRQSLEAQGATVLEMAALEIVPPSSWEPLDRAIAQLDTFDWLFLTSANGVQYFFERLLAQGKDARALAGIKIAVVGRKTAAVLKEQGLIPDFIPPHYIADELVAHFPDRDRLGSLRCLFPRVESGGREVLVQQLTAQEATVVEVPAYQSQCPSAIDPQIAVALQQQTVDVITFASSKTVEHFWQLLQQTPHFEPSGWNPILQSLKVASIGPQTSKTCRALLGKVDIEAREYTLEGLIESVVLTYS
ncbi:uroporphyrinogen-III C-methyltransferase [Altericista sp. CCNU0014]|uniref:uroporphyrinogen-III C-methyltransferase n=1 Tax=Altericista sp. CCNU0014 TaxID=3082949 RepID=UPI00384C08C2